MTDDAYLRLRGYADDLAGRRASLSAWMLRNPSAEDLDDDQYRELVARDPKPRTDDLVTAQRFHDLMAVALTAYEGRKSDCWERQEQTLGWLLIGLMVVSIIAVILATAYGVTR
jgi:hypothetical protein